MKESLAEAPLLTQVEDVWESADCLYTDEQLELAVSLLAEEICTDMSDKNPVVLCVMNGGLITTGQLLPKLPFMMQFDYIHVTRYRNGTQGHNLDWLVEPRVSLADRTVMIVDDIFDEGVTLAEIQAFCRREGANEVRTVVLVEKEHERKAPGAVVDYVAVKVPDRYVFGFGMDYKGYLRNAPGIFALKNSND